MLVGVIVFVGVTSCDAPGVLVIDGVIVLVGVCVIVGVGVSR